MNKILRIFILLPLVILVACGGSGRERDTTADDVRDNLRDLMQTTGDYMSESFAAVVEDFNKIKKNADEKIKEANAAYDNLTREARGEYRRHIESIETQYKAIDKKIEQYKAAAAEERKKIEEEVKTLKSALEKSVKAFEEEMK